MPLPKREWTPEMDAEAVRMAGEGATLREIGSALDVPSSTVWFRLHQLGVSLGRTYRVASAEQWRPGIDERITAYAACVEAGRPIEYQPFEE